MCSRLCIAVVFCVANALMLLFLRERSRHVVELWDVLPSLLDAHDYSTDEQQRKELAASFKAQVHEIRTLSTLVATLLGILTISSALGTMCVCSEWLWRGQFGKRYRVIHDEPREMEIKNQ